MNQPKPIDPEITLARAKLQADKIFESADRLHDEPLRAQTLGLLAQLNLLRGRFK